MADQADTLLLQIQEQIENGKKLAKLRIVNPEILGDLLESLRASLPGVIEEAKKIVAERGKLLTDARTQAERLVQEAQDRADQIETHANNKVHEVVAQAKEHVMQSHQQSANIIAQAEAQAVQLVQEHVITQSARESAEQILQQARAAAEEIERETRARCDQHQSEVQAYCQNLQQQVETAASQRWTYVVDRTLEFLGETEGILESNLTDVRNMKKRLQARAEQAEQPAD
ncbi:MAG: hypothetical protein LBB67_01470 [Oscillospiraceae bacterium]|jgi:vacuolar-type H+-ATPase subunit H|nr:hypothetical protein [Oscillospiraceae bacterium]